MRKYYWDLIQDNTNFRRNMRNIKLKHKMLISCSNEIIEKSPLISKMKSITFYLAALAFPIDMKKFLKISLDKSKNAPNQVKHATEMIKIIECVMNNFSIKILNRFLEITEISILLVNYLSKVSEIFLF